jgi:hypothetical protein
MTADPLTAHSSTAPAHYLALLLHRLNLSSCQALVLLIAVKQLSVIAALSDLGSLACSILALGAAAAYICLHQ